MKLHIGTGKYKNSILKVPSNSKPIKSIIKKSIFDQLINYNTIENANVLDLYAGSGSLGMECLSNGAKFVTFVEDNYGATKTINENLLHLNLQEKAEIIRRDSLKLLGETSRDFDIVFADPPYKYHTKHLLKTVHYSLKDEGIFVFAHSKRLKELDAEDLTLIKTKSYGQAAYSLYKA